jgi:AcrR family transcriptional regulator
MAKKLYALDVKERILTTARELFIQNGYNGTSIRDIATASDTNVAHVKYYFQSKYNLFEIIFEEAFEVLVERIFTTVQSDKPFLEMVELWIGAYYELLPKYPQIPIFILNEINQSQEHYLTDLIKKRNLQKVFYIITDKIEEAIKKGTIKEISTVDFGLNIASLCVFPFMVGGLAMKMADISTAEYHVLLKQHKDCVVRFVQDALKP